MVAGLGYAVRDVRKVIVWNCCLLVAVVGCGGQTAQAPAQSTEAADDPPDAAAPDPSTGGRESSPVERTNVADPATGDTPPLDATPPHPFPRSVKAPPLSGGVDWINTAGPIDLEDLRGKFVILDFWTYCCINCLHILPELKKLEKAYPNELVVIGVHSAKFTTEEETDNIREAVLRYEIEHPVVNDANHAIWNRYFVRSWPSIRIIDPEGNLVAGESSEIPFEVFDRFLKDALPYYRDRGLLDGTPLRFDLEAHKAKQTPLRFPGKVLADEQGNRLFIADSNHNRILMTDLEGRLLDTIGSGAIGAANGDFRAATFDHMQGMALKEDILYVADTENHLIRKVDLKEKQVTTIAGVGRQGRAWFRELTPGDWTGPPKTTPLNSPWALWIHGDQLYIAMAGPHQIWRMALDESKIGLYAGSGREDILDGPLLPGEPYAEGVSAFAQPSGLTGDGGWLYVADSEGSSIRAVPFDPKQQVKTIVGTAHLPVGRLFEFGDVDGQGEEVRLQHVLGVTYYREKLYVTDTYNNKIKIIDPADGTSTTLAGTGEPGSGDDPAEFDEPAGISAAVGKLYVADTNNHAIRVIDLDNENRVSTLVIEDLTPPAPAKTEARPSFPNAQQIDVPKSAVRAADGAITLSVDLQLPDGCKLNPAAPMGYCIETNGDAGPIDRTALGKFTRLDTPSTQFDIRLPVTAERGEDTVTVSTTYYYCRTGAEALCKVASAVWTVPLEVGANAGAEKVSLQAAISGDG